MKSKKTKTKKEKKEEYRSMAGTVTISDKDYDWLKSKDLKGKPEITDGDIFKKK